MADSKNPEEEPKTGAKAKSVAAGQKSVAVEEAGGADQTISLFLAVGLIVSALVVGLVVGYVVAPRGVSNDLGATTAPAAGTAPALTPEQLKSNKLPPSHPAIPGLSTGGATSQSAPAATTTGTPPAGQ
ncbi:MAG: hypothetical protein Q8L35_07700 [Actinomycetota bacterium]|nr:hypothetical protein [Actinomycetota bacterium]